MESNELTDPFMKQFLGGRVVWTHMVPGGSRLESSCILNITLSGNVVTVKLGRTLVEALSCSLKFRTFECCFTVEPLAKHSWDGTELILHLIQNGVCTLTKPVANIAS